VTDAPAVTATGTIAALWRQATAAPPAGPAYLVEEEGAWRGVSWGEAARRVDELAHGLLALGIRPGDRFSLLGATQLDWALLDWALISIGAVVVPIYETSSARECGYVLDHSGAIGVAVEDEAQRAKVEEVRGDLPALDHVLTFAELDALAERGREHAAAEPDAVERTAAAIAPDDLLTCMYTSGTTGPPKGCLLTHRNYHAMLDMVGALPDLFTSDDVTVLYLPLAHTFGRLTHFGAASIGFTIAFCPDVQRLAGALEQVRPTFLPSVPRVFEKVHGAIRAQFDEATGARRAIVDWSLAVGRRASELRREGRPLPPALALQHRLASRLVYSKVKARLGGRLRLAISGGAPLAREVAEFFHALDVLILEGYGLTECTTACAMNRPDRFRFGTVGPALPGCEVRIADDGEILLRGENVFAGYYRDEEATRAVVDEDGWLRTGDVGELDADGFLRITDRKKDLIVTAGGKNVAPQNLENALKRSPLVSQALVVGDRRPYVAALVTLDAAEAERVAGQDVQALVQAAVDEVNRDLARYEQIKRFAILPRDFTQAAGEVTPTLKLRRRVVEERYAAEIAALYDS
jgi:long-chain acyl-CoA synthetase